MGEFVGTIEAETEETNAEETAEPAHHVDRPVHCGCHLDKTYYTGGWYWRTAARVGHDQKKMDGY